MACCDELEMALEHGLLVRADSELVLPLRALKDVNPDAVVGNVLTGEDYDPDEFSLTMAITFCPWCATKVTPRQDYTAYGDGFTPDDELFD